MKVLSTLVFVFLGHLVFSQISFTNQNSLLTNPSHFSGVIMSVSDMNGDGLDDIIRYDQGRMLNVEYQSAPNAPFTSLSYGNVESGSEWSNCIADYDNNGFNDILVGGAYTNIKLFQANAAGTNFSQYNLPASNIFLQGSNFVDINNDGWVDIYACHDDDESRKYRNLQNGTFIEEDMLETTLPSGNDGNYASIWTDYDGDCDMDLYISKCRGGVTDPTDPRRVNLLFQNDGNHVFTEVGAAAGLNIGGQSWATDFADIDNDGDLDCYVLNHDVESQLMRNNGDGTFTDVSAGSNLGSVFGSFGLHAIFRDFDNDGYVDLLYVGAQQALFRNNGNMTFTEITNAFDNNTMSSIALGDLNDDGYIDVYGGYGNIIISPSNIPDKLWMNAGGTNNYLKVNLQGVNSNRNAIGARIEISGPFGIQVREVRSGEGYGIHNSFIQHFGLGTNTTINSVTIKWPSGIVDQIDNPAINQTLQVTEGDNMGCTDRFVINSEPIPARTFNARQTITSTGTVAAATTVDFEAGQYIELQPGFVAHQNGDFTAQIIGCR